MHGAYVDSNKLTCRTHITIQYRDVTFFSNLVQCWSCVANAIVLVNSSGAGVHAIRLYMLTLCPKFTCCKPGFSETSVWIVALFYLYKNEKGRKRTTPYQIQTTTTAKTTHEQRRCRHLRIGLLQRSPQGSDVCLFKLD